jgi:hypothetical protein
MARIVSQLVLAATLIALTAAAAAAAASPGTDHKPGVSGMP